MHWVIQNNIYAEEGFEVLLATLTRLQLSYSVHKVIPFIGEITDAESIPSSDRVIVMGSYSMAREAVKRGWKPGAFLDNLDFRVQWENWGERMLNADAYITRFDAVLPHAEPFFLRPVHDTKAFTGLVIDWPTYEQWRENLVRLPETKDPVNDPLGVHVLTGGTEVMVCKRKMIYNETRTWVVDGRVVTASGYKLGTIKRYTAPEQVEPRIIEFANDCASIWSPNRAYVLDVADTDEGLKIVEVNNLNSAGWYKADLGKLVMALENMDA